MTMRLPAELIARPWGCTTLPAPFAAPAGERIGEIRFDPQAPLDQLLVKYIFTSEALSVQVHPPADWLPEGSGKDECWLIVHAVPGARLGIGCRQHLSAEQLRNAALDGSIEGLLTWYEVKAGDFFYIPAGTIHVIGAGISLIEVQQNNEITYRLYDYGRPRELHLEAGMAVAKGEPYPAELRKCLPETGHMTLVNGPFFQLERLDGMPDTGLCKRYQGPLLVIPTNGHVKIADLHLQPGECGMAMDLGDLVVAGTCLIAQPCPKV